MGLHSGPARIELPGVPELHVVDVASAQLPESERQARMAYFRDAHQRFFPEHPQQLAEVDAFLSGAWDSTGIVPHLWVLCRGESCVGYVLLFTDTKRCVTLIHFVAVEQDLRPALPHGWLRPLADAWEAAGAADCERLGSTLIGLAGEVPPEAVGMWRPCGFEPSDIAYREVRHGRYWQQYGEPEFFPMTLVVRVAAGGAALGRRAVEDAAALAFACDHYLLPEDHPVVVAMLARDS